MKRFVHLILKQIKMEKERYRVTELDLIIDFDLITEFREVSIEHLQWMSLGNRGRLLLSHMRLAFRQNVETILS